MITTIGYHIICLSVVCGLLTAVAAVLFIPYRWFCRPRLLELLLCYIALWLWASIGWALLFGWPFVERGLVL